MKSHLVRAGVLLGFLLAIACGGGGDISQDPQGDEKSPFDLAIANAEAVWKKDAEDSDRVGGIGAGILSDDSLYWSGGYGWADGWGIGRESKRVNEHTLFRIGSISKTFTAVLMMRLVEMGVIDLDEPVSAYLPEIRGLANAGGNADAITFRHLASHTAGLEREPSLPGAASGPIAEWETKLLESIPHTAMVSVPGTTHLYSNIGFGILGLALSRAAGEPFMELMKALVFDPLQLTSTTFVLTGDQWDRLATGFAVGSGGTVSAAQPEREHEGRGYKVPNGGIYSTVADLVRFMASMIPGSGTSILSPGSRGEMHREQLTGSAYGLGMRVRNEGDVQILGHQGSVSGYNARMAYNTSTGVGVIILRNYDEGNTNLEVSCEGLLYELALARR